MSSFWQRMILNIDSLFSLTILSSLLLSSFISQAAFEKRDGYAHFFFYAYHRPVPFFVVCRAAWKRTMNLHLPDVCFSSFFLWDPRQINIPIFSSRSFGHSIQSSEAEVWSFFSSLIQSVLEMILQNNAHACVHAFSAFFLHSGWYFVTLFTRETFSESEMDNI